MILPKTLAIRAFVVAAVCAFGASLPFDAAVGQASSANASAIADLDRFAHEYYEAATQHDAAKMRGLFAPGTRACIDQVSSNYFGQEVSLFPRDVTNSSLSARPLGPADAARMSVAQPPDGADLLVLIDWKETSRGASTNHPNLVALKRIEGRLLAVVNCPSPADIQRRNAFFARRQPHP